MTAPLSYAESLKLHYIAVRRRLGMYPAVAVARPLALPPPEALVVSAVPGSPAGVVSRRGKWPEKDASRQQLTVHHIIAATANAAWVSAAEIRSPRRNRNLSEWRQAAMYVAVTLRPDLAFTYIASVFRKDHSTVMYAHKRVSKQFPRFADKISRIMDGLDLDS